jgi:peptide/nickel transport system permease protein
VALLVLRNMFQKITALKFLFGSLNSIRFIVVLLSFFGWMGVARIVRGAVLSLKEREFVEASRALGAKTSRIIVRHILPNTIGPLLAATTLSVVGAIGAESTLSFFGYGLDPSRGKTSWGNLLSDAKGAVITGKWWMVVFPSVVFVFVMMCINFVGDGLRDAFDPKQDKGRA